MFKESLSDKTSGKISGLAPNNVPRKLSARDVALGIGRKATEEEIEEYLYRPHGKTIPLKDGIEQIKAKLAKKQSLKNKWK
ncbi:MAG TPA: hypothetical protein PLW44_03430 [Chitinophagales bacterium]|nr:hypothetical protein [Chitinophagales bacterium]